MTFLTFDRFEVALACIEAGLVTVQEAADVMGLDPSTLRKQCARRGIDPRRKREAKARAIIGEAIRQEWRPRAPDPATRRKGRTKQRARPERPTPREKALDQIKAGALTIPKAARRLRIPISGVLTAMRAARIPIPAPYNKRDTRKSDATPNT